MKIVQLYTSFKLRLYTIIIKGRFKKFGRNSFVIPSINQIVGGGNVEIGDGVKIGRMATITTWKGNESEGHILIKNSDKLGDFIHISAIDRIEIGENVLTGRWVTIVDNAHGCLTDYDTAPINRQLISKGSVTIGRNVWIADKVTICPGVSIGDGSIIGANSVVTKSIPPFSIAAGVPAKIINKLHT